MKTEEILAKLSEECANTIITVGELKKGIEQGLREDERFVPYWAIQQFIEYVRQTEKWEEDIRIASTHIKQFLFVEDGSVDSDNLIETLETKNPEIKVVVYRQGAVRPQLVDMANNTDK